MIPYDYPVGVDRFPHGTYDRPMTNEWLSAVMESRGFSAATKVAAWSLASRGKAVVTVSLNELCDATGKTGRRRTELLSTRLAELEEHGFLLREARRGRKMQYTLVTPATPEVIPAPVVVPPPREFTPEQVAERERILADLAAYDAQQAGVQR